jgi:hypothetical protein
MTYRARWLGRRAFHFWTPDQYGLGENLLAQKSEVDNHPTSR